MYPTANMGDPQANLAATVVAGPNSDATTSLYDGNVSFSAFYLYHCAHPNPRWTLMPRDLHHHHVVLVANHLRGSNMNRMVLLSIFLVT